MVDRCGAIRKQLGKLSDRGATWRCDGADEGWDAYGIHVGGHLAFLDSQQYTNINVGDRLARFVRVVVS